MGEGLREVVLRLGRSGVGGARQVPAEDWDRTFAVLLRSVFLGIKHSILPMRKVGGSIISTAAIAGILGQAGPLVYSVAMALYLAGDNAAWVTGAAMVVEGGSVARGSRLGRQSVFDVPAKWSGPSFEKD